MTNPYNNPEPITTTAKNHEHHTIKRDINLEFLGIQDAKLCFSDNSLWLEFYDILRIRLNHSLFKRSINQNLKITNQKRFLRTLKLLMPQLLLQSYNKLTNRFTVFVSEITNLPCIGTRYYGIIDRSTNIIELRPNTGCNLSCVFCSVGEGFDIKKNDFILDYKYLSSWVDYVIEFKHNDVELLINPQGEPLIYPKISELVELLNSNNKVGKISIVTNGLLLRNKYKSLINAGVKSFHVSFPGFSNLKPLVGVEYPANTVADTIRELSNKNIEIWLTPVWIKGLNDNQIREVVAFAKELNKTSNAKIMVGIQNYVAYRSGKTIPGYSQVTWGEFYRFLNNLEKEYKIDLHLKREDAGIIKDNPIPKPLKTNHVVKAKIVSVGRTMKDAIAVIGEGFDARAIMVNNAKHFIGKTVNIKIKHSLHNLYHGILL